MSIRIDLGEAPGLEVPLTTLANRIADSASVTQTRANNTTAYGAGDVLGGILPSDSTLGGPCIIDFYFPKLDAALRNGGELLVTSSELERDVTALISGETNYSLYLYNVPPVSGLLDNAAFDISAGDRVGFVGKVNLGTPVDEVSTLYVRQDGLNQQVTVKSAHLYAYLVTVGAYTPAASTVLKVTLHALAV